MSTLYVPKINPVGSLFIFTSQYTNSIILHCLSFLRAETSFDLGHNSNLLKLQKKELEKLNDLHRDPPNNL